MDDGLLYRFDLLVRAIHRLLSVFGKTRILSIAGLFEEHFECPLRWELVFGHSWKLPDLSRVLSELPCFELEGLGDFFVSAVEVIDRSAFDPPKKHLVLRALRRRLQIVPSQMLKRNLQLPPTHWTERAMEAEKEANDLYEAAERHVLSNDRTVQELEDKARDSAVMYEQQARQSRKMQRAQTMTQLHMVLAAEDAVREVRKHYDDALLRYSSQSAHQRTAPSSPTAPSPLSDPPPAPHGTHTPVKDTPRVPPVPPRGLPVAAGNVTFAANKVRSNALQQLPRARIGETKTRPSSVDAPSAKRTAPAGRSNAPDRSIPMCADFRSERSPAHRSGDEAGYGRGKYGLVIGRTTAGSEERASSSQSSRFPVRASPVVPKNRNRDHRAGSEGRSASNAGGTPYPRTASPSELLTLVAGLSKMHNRSAPPVTPVPPSQKYNERTSGGHSDSHVGRVQSFARVRPSLSCGRENLSIYRATRGRTPTGERKPSHDEPRCSWPTEKSGVKRETDSSRVGPRKRARCDGAPYTNSGGTDGTFGQPVGAPPRQQRLPTVGAARGSGFSIRRPPVQPRVVRTGVALPTGGMRSVPSGPLLRHPDMRARPYPTVSKRPSESMTPSSRSGIYARPPSDRPRRPSLTRHSHRINIG